MSPSRRTTAVAVVLWVGLSLTANGYVFGVDDHGIHLSFLDMVFHPGRWEGDLLREAASHHHSLVWLAQAPFAALLGVSTWTGLLHVACLAATAWTIVLLCDALWESETAPSVALLMLASGHAALGGADTLDPLLLGRGAALPLELLAFWLLLRGRATGAFLVCGVAVAVHAPSGVASAAGLVGAHVATHHREPRELRALLWLGVGALPVLLWWALAGGISGGMGRVDDAWAVVLDARLSHHLDPSAWPLEDAVGVAGWVVLAVVGLVRVRPRDGTTGPLLGLFGGLALWATVAGLWVGPKLGLALALQLEPMQTTRLLVVLAAVAGAGWLTSFESIDLAGGAVRLALVLAYAAGVGVVALPLVAFVALVERRGILAPERWQAPLVWAWVGILGAAAVAQASVAALLAVVLIAALWNSTRGGRPLEEMLVTPSLATVGLALVAMFAIGRGVPDGDAPARLLPTGEASEERLVARWLGDNVEAGALVAVPPHRFATARGDALRPLFVTWKDGGEALFDRDVALEWRRRLQVACACRPLDSPLPPDSPPGTRLAALRDRLEEGLHLADRRSLAASLAAEGADYIVIWSYEPGPAIEGTEPLLKTESYQVYALPLED